LFRTCFSGKKRLQRNVIRSQKIILIFIVLNSNTWHMKKIILLISLALMSWGASYAQNDLSAALKQVSASGKFDTLIYYGVDFSRVRINDAPKISKNAVYSQAYPPSWIAYVEKEMPPDVYVRNMLQFRNFIYKQQDIFHASVAVSPKFITGYDNSIPPDTLTAMIAKYSLQAKSGLGLVLIPELFSKPQETAYTWVVFFDVKSRKILYKAKTTGKCAHMGYTAHWASGVVDGFENFANH